MGKSNRVSGWDVLVGSEDRVMVLSASHLQGDEEDFRD